MNDKKIYSPLKKVCFVRCDNCGELKKYVEIEEIALTKEKICIKCLDKRKEISNNKGFFFYP